MNQIMKFILFESEKDERYFIGEPDEYDNNTVMQRYSQELRDNRSRGYADRNQASRVLLVCVYDTVALEVSNQLIYERFSRFGSILKVLIFEKGEVTKLFVEYTEKEHAQQAKNALDGTKLLGAICKMNIHFSNFSNVDLKNQTTQGADFSMQEEIRNDYVRRFDTLTRSYQEEQNESFNDDFLLQAAFSPFVPRSKTDNPRRLQQAFNKVNHSNSNYLYPQSNIYPQAMINQEQELDNMIHHGIDNILQTHSHTSHKQLPNTRSTTGTDRINSSLKIKEVSQAKSSVISFQLSKDISIRCVYNLFSNFGNISYITKKPRRIFVKFRNMEFAAIALTYLNEYFFMGNVLKLDSPSDCNEAMPKQSEYSQCIFFDESSDRFTAHRSLTVNSPSQTLHVSSLKKQICREGTLYKIFSDFGKVQAVKIICYSNQKNMALVKFSSMESSFQAIANLHNESFAGRKMQISFTKSKI